MALLSTRVDTKNMQFNPNVVRVDFMYVHRYRKVHYSLIILFVLAVASAALCRVYHVVWDYGVLLFICPQSLLMSNHQALCSCMRCSLAPLCRGWVTGAPRLKYAEPVALAFSNVFSSGSLLSVVCSSGYDLVVVCEVV